MENQVATTNEIKKTKKRKNSNSQMLEWKKDGWKALISLAPAMIILLIFTFYPIVNTFVVSFFPNYNYITDNFGAFGFDSYIKVLTDADIAAKEAQIKMLTESINRREKLLSNENYVNKAPQNIVEMDCKKLEEEKKKLEELMK